MLVKMETGATGGGYNFPFNFTNVNVTNIKTSGNTLSINYDSTKKYIFLNSWDYLSESDTYGKISQYSIVENGIVTDVYKVDGSAGTYSITVGTNSLTATKQGTSSYMSYCMWIELSE